MCTLSIQKVLNEKPKMIGPNEITTLLVSIAICKDASMI